MRTRKALLALLALGVAIALIAKSNAGERPDPADRAAFDRHGSDGTGSDRSGARPTSTSAGWAANAAQGFPNRPAPRQTTVQPDPSSLSWRPPLGIPAPPFGITDTAPSSPNGWTAPAEGFFYVDATNRNARDIGNPYGTPAMPRLTIPLVLPAGSVVELHGVYDQPHSSPNGLMAQGTAANPVFIRGASRSDRPVIRRNWEMRGTYYVLENLEFGPAADRSTSGSLVVLSPTSHGVLRHSEMHGTPTEGGMGVENWNNGASGVDNVVIYDNSFHDNGDVNATYDQDVEGIHIGSYVHHVWVVDNELYRNSGDGIQINGTEPLKATTHHIFVGRNVSHHNKQGGFWVKQAVDVIFSQNVAYSHRPGNSSQGHCLGGQYAPDFVWWIFNHAYDCEYGIALMSDFTDGGPTHAFFIGNVIHNIHKTTLDVPAGNAWGSAAIMMAGGYERYLLNNTIYDVDGGINSPSPFGSLDIVNNIIVNVTAPAGSHVNIEFPSLASHTRVHHNLFFPEPRVAWGDPSSVRLTDAQLAAAVIIAAPPGFVDPLKNDFHLRTDSPAVGRGAPHLVYAAYLKRYGVDIGSDIEGKPRTNLSMGAYEPAGEADSRRLR
jgi:hypothetical protein